MLSPGLHHDAAVEHGPRAVPEHPFVVLPTHSVWRVVYHVGVIVNMVAAKRQVQAVKVGLRLFIVQVDQRIPADQGAIQCHRSRTELGTAPHPHEQTADMKTARAFLLHGVMGQAGITLNDDL